MKHPFRRLGHTQLSDYVGKVAWSPDGQTLAAISAQGELTLFTQATQNLRSRVDVQTSGELSLDCLGFSAGGQFLAVGGQGGKLQIWSVPDLSLLFAEIYPTAWIDQLAWHPQLPLLAIGVGRKTYLWDGVTRQHSTTFDLEASTVLSLAWHPAGEYLAVGGHGGVKIWDRNHPDITPKRLEVPGASLNVAWSAAGTYLASGNLDRTLSVLEWGTPPPWLMQGFPAKVSQVAWSNGSTPMLAAACSDGITVWQQYGQWKNHILEANQGVIKAIAFQPQSQLLASGGDADSIVLWQQAQTISQRLKGPQGGIASLAWHPHGRYLAVGGMAGQIEVWQQATSPGFG